MQCSKNVVFYISFFYKKKLSLQKAEEQMRHIIIKPLITTLLCIKYIALGFSCPR